MTAFETIGDFKKEIINNAQLQQDFKTDPVAAAQNIEEKSPMDSDPWIYRIVVSSLGAAILTIIIGVIILMAHKGNGADTTVPTILTAIGSGAIGALGGLLAPSPKSAKS